MATEPVGDDEDGEDGEDEAVHVVLGQVAHGEVPSASVSTTYLFCLKKGVKGACLLLQEMPQAHSMSMQSQRLML